MKTVAVLNTIALAAAQTEMPAAPGVDVDAGEFEKYDSFDESQYQDFDSSFWEEQFLQMDINGDGFLSIEEALNVAGSEEEKESIHHFMESADMNEDGNVDLEEYKTFAQKHEEHSFDERLQIIEDEFVSADTDGDGFVTEQEVKEIIGEEADPAELLSFFSMADLDGDKKLSYDEYVEYAFNNNFDEQDGYGGYEAEPEL